MVVDNATSNDVMVRLLKSWLKEKSLLCSKGALFHVRCSAHILNLIVQDGLQVIVSLISKIRDSVRYLKRSPSGKQKFDLAVSQLKLNGLKKVPMDVPTRWNSTYEMLEAALPLRDAFARLDLIDKNYDHNPSDEEWEIATIICECLEVFFKATCHFSGTCFPTSNVFFPEICKIQMQLNEWETSEYDFLRLMAKPMSQKFAKYWDESCLALAISVVLDPRCKMAVVEFYYEQIYGPCESTSYIDRVHTIFSKLFDEYDSGGGVLEGSSSSRSHAVMGSSKHNLDGF
ncbi:zinc finger BED domain-containing protein RICESLEEPER 1-like [Rhododendron vialii]|uniref:zinc finger BED domain-containing protein RICESLEEPER 1-like n=1 Tax=Rhododendron vialii TaxID=182163 RepID=UPI00265E15E8|nr:zinc finger BED domain-containing protein RICESLEEPER 1-like [Rhododendron vialii]XP_058190312.1 zinc finger BED domain-containing protein RICESLEEPER 1-like [Rhododendron vialii]XP_058190313.1 zinc finger BED domain-containing protein RICESLEEPER 1-like [Rhododendron vialii]